VVRAPSPLPAAEEPGGFDALYREHAGRVARWAARLGGPSVDVDEVVQEVFLVVHQQLPSFRGEARVTTWLYRITANIARHRRRRARWWRLLAGEPADALDRLPSPRPTPVEELERRQAADRVYRILDGMNDRYRTLLILFELEGLDADAISELTGHRPETLWVALHRARTQFVARLQRDLKARP